MKNIPPQSERCSEQVSPNDRWGAFHSYQCYKKAVVQRNGKLYCKIHDPEYIKVKQDKRYNEHMAQMDKGRKRFERNQMMNQLFDGIDTDTIKNKFAQYEKAILLVK